MNFDSMDDQRKVRPVWLAGVAIGAVCALLVWPQTHRLVAGQLRLTIPTSQSIAAASPGGFTEPVISDYVWPIVQRCADQNPNDLDLQIAAATVLPITSVESSENPPGSSQKFSYKVKRLQKLIPRFADRPAMYAAVLRYSTSGDVRCTREEEKLFLPVSAPDSHNPMDVAHSLPSAIEEFDRECAAAEVLDPDNGFFPVMRSIGLFEAHKDAEGISALERAAQCPHWKEYLSDGYNGELTLQSAVSGSQGPLQRAGFAASILLPHLSAIRAVTRLALYEAVQREQAGQLADGLRIRTAVRNVGELMRSESQNLIGTLVGMNIVTLSLMRPAGAAVGPKGDVFKNKEIRNERLRNFDLYLTRAGHSGDIAGLHAEMDACVKTRAIISAGIGKSVFDTCLTNVLGLNIADLITLCTVVWLVGIAGIVWLLAAIAASKPMMRLPRLARFTFMTLTGLAASAVMIALLAQQANGCVGAVARLGQMWFTSEDGTTPPHNVVSMLLDGYVWIVATIPILTILTLGCLCLMWRAPLLAGMARGMRGAILPLCSVIIIGYAVLATVTSAYERTFDERMTESFVHEGRAIATMVGAEWPDRVRVTDSEVH